MRCSGGVWAAVVLLCLAGRLSVGAGWDGLGDQPGTERFTLGNGLGVVIVSTSEYGRAPSAVHEGAGALQLWLIVRAGSMHELGDQRGAARVVERLVRAGTLGHDRGAMDGLLGGASMGRGASSGSYVGFDHATYMAQVGGGDQAEIERVLGLYADLLDPSGWGHDRDAFAAAKEELLGEVMREMGPELRARQGWLPELMRGTRFGARLPLPDEAELRALSWRRTQAFARACYGPGQAVLLVLGDVDADGDGADIRAAVTRVLGGVMGGGAAPAPDLRLGRSVAGRAVLGHDAGLERHQAALVWFEDRGDETLAPWDARAAAYGEGDIRSMIVSRVAGEIVRHRLGRLGLAELGPDVELGVEQVDLFGQIDLLQIGAEGEGVEGDEWGRTLGFLVGQCDRLRRDGAGEEEVIRARLAVLSRWHREADDWRERSNAARASFVHWMITTGRPVVDMVRWDARATEIMAGITDREIDARMRWLIDPRRAAAIAVTSDAGAAGGRGAVARSVERALGEGLEALDADWMLGLAGSLIDGEPRGGAVEEIVQHPGAGVWDALLTSGVRVLARRVGDGSGRARLCATVWGDGLASGELSEREISAAMVAWAAPACESRGGREVALFMAEHDLAVEAERTPGGVQLRIDAPASELTSALELMYVLLDEPLIEREAHREWAASGGAKEDVIDTALEMLYRPWRRVGEEAVTLDRAQRVLTQMARNGRIDVGIAGDVDPGEMIEEASRLLGALVRRDAADAGSPARAALSRMSLRERAVAVRAAEADQQGWAIGFVLPREPELSRLRAMVLGAMVLDRRLGELAKAEGLEGRVRAYIASADALADQRLLLVRVWGDAHTQERARGIVDAALSELDRDGVSEEALAPVRGRVVGSLGEYFGAGWYWSSRLSTVGLHERSVEDLWTIREGYAGIDAQAASEAMRELISSQERFRVRVEAGER